MIELTGKTALVTGGGRGIGRAAALELARRGAKVALAARSLDEIEAVAAEIRQLGGPVLTVKADLSQSEQAVSSLIGKVEAELGPVEVLVNNAAMAGPFGASWELDPSKWAQAVEVNVIAPFRLAHAVVPEMRKRGWGRIINVSAVVARQPLEGAGAYSTTKAALDMLTRQLGQELGDSGVVAISFYPGMVDTAMQADIRQQPVEKVGRATAEIFHNFYASGRLQQPQRPGRLIAILAGEAGADKNGQILDIYDSPMQQLLEEQS